MRLTVVAVPAPWWLVAAVTAVGAALGWWLARQLATAGYRLDEEQTRQLPLPPTIAAVAVPALWGLLAWRLGGLADGALLPAFLLLAWAGVALAWIDLDVHRLPEGLSFPVVLALLVLLTAAAAFTGQWGALGRALVCGASAWVVFFALAITLRGGIGLFGFKRGWAVLTGSGVAVRG